MNNSKLWYKIVVQIGRIKDDYELAPWSPLAVAAGPASHHPDRQPCDTAVVVEGLRSLSLPPALLGGPVSKVPTDSDEEELAPVTLVAAKSSLVAAQPAEPAQPSKGGEAKASGGWQEVLRHRGPCHSASSAVTLSPRSIPAWLFGRCFRCLAYGHRVADCRDPLRCPHCLENEHRASECRDPWRPLSSLSCLVTPPVCSPGAEHTSAKKAVSGAPF
jgi:hypothetical protein